jgi:hypothetical protein
MRTLNTAAIMLFQLVCLVMIFLMRTIDGRSLRTDSNENTETQLQEYLARRFYSGYQRDNSLEEVEKPHYRENFVAGVGSDDNDHEEDEMMQLRNEIPQPPPKPEEIGAPNLFNLPGLSENNRKDIQLLEGDIAVSRDRNAYQVSGKWSYGIVPYEFSSGYTAQQQNTIKAAMAAITSGSNNCIKFVPRGSYPVWLRIYPGQG